MFLYIYYAKKRGVHDSGDDVAVVTAWTKKQAIKILSKHLQHFDIRNVYRLKGVISIRRRGAYWISDY